MFQKPADYYRYQSGKFKDISLILQFVEDAERKIFAEFDPSISANTLL